MENNEIKTPIVETKKPTVKKTTAKKPAVKTKIDPKTGTLKVVESKKAKSKTETKKSATKASSNKKSTTKAGSTKKVTKKPTTKTTKPKVTKPKVEKVIIETPVVETVVNEPVMVDTPVVVESNVINQTTDSQPLDLPKKRGRKPSLNPLPKKNSRELTIEPEPRKPKEKPVKPDKKVNAEPEVIVRPTPKKIKVLTKEEKVIYKKLEEAFTYIANYTNVIEEKTMDPKQIGDLTINELHVIEMVDQNNNKPMSLIAKNLKVTIGSLTVGVNRLVQKGYLLRMRDIEDHRIILLSITQKGKKVLKIHDTFHDIILGLALEGITLQQAMKVMTQFALVLENYYDPKSITTIDKPTKGTKK